MSAKNAIKTQRTSISTMIKRKICLYKINHPNCTRKDICHNIMEEDSLKISPSTIGDILRDTDRWMSTGSEDKNIMIQPRGRIVQPPVKPYKSIAEAIPVCQRLLATLQSHDKFSEQDYGPLVDLIRKMHAVNGKPFKVKIIMTDIFDE